MCVVGNWPELGSWDTARAVPLKTGPKRYPGWSSGEVWFAVPEGQEIINVEYKYIRRAGPGVVWEDAVPNRCVNLRLRRNGALWLARDCAFNAAGSSPPAPAVKQYHNDDPEPEWTDRRHSSPEWGGEDVSGVADEQEEFTPSTRQASLAHLEAPSPHSLLGCIPDEPDEEELMVRQASQSMIGSQSVMAREESFSGVPSQMCRESSFSNLFGEDREAFEPASFEASYRVVGDDPLGEGTFGLVWRCQLLDGDNSTAKAVKRVRKSHLKPRDLRNLFGHQDKEGEIQMHLRLKHRHIVELYEFFDDLDTVSLVMEYCGGGDLFDLVASHHQRTGRGLGEAGATTVIRHVLSGLAFLHSNKIVHRDVKCENVLLLEAGAPSERTTYKLCDFGFAATLGPSGSLLTQLGSPDSVAPEVVRRQAYSAPADLWSTGVVLYMTISANSPFWAPTDREVLERVKEGNFEFRSPCWADVSCGAKDTISALLTVDQRERITAEAALRLRWVCAEGE